MNAKLTIQGGNPLKGQVQIDGAKNSALPLLAATLLTDKPVVLHNVPRLEDVKTMLDMISYLGKEVVRQTPTRYLLRGKVEKTVTPPQLVRKMRASFLVLAPLLGKAKRAEISLPGGCTIGSRPINLHLKGLENLGATINQQEGKIVAQTKELVGEEIYLDFPSVGATEQLLMAGATCSGRTTIYNPAREPEIEDLVCFLRKMGADVEFTPNSISVSNTKENLKVEHSVIPDRIEAGTYLIAAVATGGEITLTKVNPEHNKALILKLKEINVNFVCKENSITVSNNSRPDGTTIKTLPYPGFPTDLQAPVTSMLALAQGKSLIKETVFDSRVDHVPELNKMGARITVEGSNTILINGAKALQGALVEAPDIRAGAALVIGGLAANGTTEVSGLSHIDRGYSNIEDKLSQLGAKVQRV